MCKSVNDDVWALNEPDAVRLAMVSSEGDMQEEVHLVAAEALAEREPERGKALKKALQKKLVGALGIEPSRARSSGAIQEYKPRPHNQC